MYRGACARNGSGRKGVQPGAVAKDRGARMARVDDRAEVRRVRTAVLRFVYRGRRGRASAAAGTIHTQPGCRRAFARCGLAIATGEISARDRKRLTDTHLRLY